MRTETAAKAPTTTVIDYFALGLTHALIMIALLRLIGRDDLDHEDELDDRPKKPLRIDAQASEGSADA